MNEPFKFCTPLAIILKGFSRNQNIQIYKLQVSMLLETVIQSVFLTDDVSIFHLNSS